MIQSSPKSSVPISQFKWVVLEMKHIKHFKIHIFRTLLKVNKSLLKWLELLPHMCKKRDFWSWMLAITTETSGMHLYQGPSQGRTLKSIVTLCKPWLTPVEYFKSLSFMVLLLQNWSRHLLINLFQWHDIQYQTSQLAPYQMRELVS